MYDYKIQKELMLIFLHDILAYKDRGTWRHSIRVGELCQGIANILGLSYQDSADVAMAGYFHDIGKIYLLEVINQPGQLANRQRELMIHHPQYGSELLANQWRNLPEDINLGILLHHERLDGTGYPFKLQGEDIPLIARIVAVADVYDAMSNDRPYHPALPRSVIMKELHREGYAPKVVQALEEYLALPEERMLEVL